MVNHSPQFKGLERLLKDARVKGDKLLEAKILMTLSVAYARIENKEKALAYHWQAVYISEELNQVAYELYKNAEFDKALKYLSCALEMSQALNEIERGIAVLNNMAMIFSSLGEYSKAVIHYERSLQLAQICGSVHHEVTTLRGLGLLYRDQLALPERALECFERALQRLNASSPDTHDPDNIFLTETIKELMNRG
jgi:tetratricopeptide (TPR) repeat protein